jgi:hypothetical protein
MNADRGGQLKHFKDLLAAGTVLQRIADMNP